MRDDKQLSSQQVSDNYNAVIAQVVSTTILGGVAAHGASTARRK